MRGGALRDHFNGIHEVTGSIPVSSTNKQTARFIAGVLDDGRTRGEFRTDFDSTSVAHAILGSIAGATQQHLANTALKLEGLLDCVRRMALGYVRG